MAIVYAAILQRRKERRTMVDIEKVLKVEGVSNSYKKRNFGFGSKDVQVLDNINFHINKREFFGLVGESGCGKSTLCRAILGLIDFDGKITISNLNRKEDKKKVIARKVQAVFQDPMSALNPKKTVGFLLEEPLRIHKIGTKKERSMRVDEILELVGLDSSYRERYPSELSGGQCQRVCIGCALILNPNLIIADEAVSALDVSVGAQILNLFQELHDSFAMSFLFVSHDLNLVYYLCDRIAVMYKGSIVEMGDAEAIYYHPLHPYTQLLLSSIPKLEEEGQKEICNEEKDMMTNTVVSGCKYYQLCKLAKEECKTWNNMLINAAENNEKQHYVSCPYYNY